MNFYSPVTLGWSGLRVGRLGISSSYGAPAEAFEEAFEMGCNYFTYGTFIKGGSPEMRKAIRNLVQKGQRDRLVVAVYTYAHWPWLTRKLLARDLNKLGIEFADVLILGYYPSVPDRKTFDMTQEMKQKGLIRAIGLSGHNRKLFPELARRKLVDICHIRYNAINRGAEREVFPHLHQDDRPGVVSFTATRWGKLINPKLIPQGRRLPTAADAYRFVLTNPAVDVCMIGTRSREQMREDLKVLELGPLSEEEMKEIRETGDYLYAH
jgi:aryl-alcohol dehydrogenase-like predicted oxidoreductase